MDTQIAQRIARWLEPPFDQETQESIIRLREEDPKALEDAFSAPLTFGTGGMRSIMGVGTARLNTYTVMLATQGLASYLMQVFPEERCKVFISHDSRHNSRLFALRAAEVLAGNGMEPYVTSELRPTPFVSFGCRALGCRAGIMITASHNPSDYNGYKVYWDDGAQVLAPHDKGIIAAIEKLDFSDIVRGDTLSFTGAALDEAYFKAISEQARLPDQNHKKGHSLDIVFSPLHGAGGTLVPQALEKWGFTSLAYVASQKDPNGDFPTTKSPNPEDAKALTLGKEQLLRDNADIFIATDPDADRLGIVVRDGGQAVGLTGNQTAALMLNHLLTHTALHKKDAVVSTIVTSRLLERLCEAHDVTYCDVLTGFKYIGEKMRQWEEAGSYRFLFGAEESYGYLVGTHARDKDAVIASCVLAEAALDAKQHGETLIDRLQSLYETYGVFVETQRSVTFPPSAASMEIMRARMRSLRERPPQAIASAEVTHMRDYLSDDTGLPRSDMLQLFLRNGVQILIRPSGTEPKIKIYGMVHRDRDESPLAEQQCKAEELLEAMLEECKEQHLVG